MTDTPAKESLTGEAIGRSRALLAIAIFSGLILLCWCFPEFWYTRSNEQQSFVWYNETTNVDGWKFKEVPVAEAAEKLLVADRLFNGQFYNNQNTTVAVFSAKRYQEKQNEIGLFVHTPDRCWTESGWRIEPLTPDVVELNVHGVPLQLERRVFAYDKHRELVYFCGLVGGQTLPYRLDHNLAVGQRQLLRAAVDKTGSTLRASDSRLWQRVWDSFVSRRRLLGPKQFLRISTSIQGGNIEKADELLQQLLPQWLVKTDYLSELRTWHDKKSSTR